MTRQVGIGCRHLDAGRQVSKGGEVWDARRTQTCRLKRKHVERIWGKQNPSKSGGHGFAGCSDCPPDTWGTDQVELRVETRRPRAVVEPTANVAGRNSRGDMISIFTSPALFRPVLNHGDAEAARSWLAQGLTYVLVSQRKRHQVADSRVGRVAGT
jgi:hypothetical protein